MSEDQHVVDSIATYLGTRDEWPAADALEVIAELIGMVRPHPGGVPGDRYRQLFYEATGRDTVETFDWTQEEKAPDG